MAVDTASEGERVSVVDLDVGRRVGHEGRSALLLRRDLVQLSGKVPGTFVLHKLMARNTLTTGQTRIKAAENQKQKGNCDSYLRQILYLSA